MTEHKSPETITVRGPLGRTWMVSTNGYDVILTSCHGPLELPGTQIAVWGGCAHSVAKAITKLAKRTKPRSAT